MPTTPVVSRREFGEEEVVVQEDEGRLAKGSRDCATGNHPEEVS